ncbi:hypothetical protein HDU84_000390 [Entophlyctis sp. JEL0112]|nr:hypothetical protein HDU84_000390 [Entophlyctis sp. JEL0112]
MLCESILNERLVFNEPFELGLKADPSGDVFVLQPGTYEIPFIFPLPNDLPPSFMGVDGKVNYYLNAMLTFKEKMASGTVSFFDKRISESIFMPHYNSQHIVSTKDAGNLTASSPLPSFTTEPLDENIGQLDQVVASPNFAARLPPQSPSSSRRLDFSPPLPSIDEKGGENSSPATQGFSEPAIISNLNARDPVKYQIIVPHCRFGRDDPVVVHIHISKLPEGFEIHHVDLSIEAEVSRMTSKGTKSSSQQIMHYRDTADHVSAYWNRKIVVPAANVFRTYSSDSVNNLASEVHIEDSNWSVEPVEESSETGNDEVPLEQPPSFDEIQQDFNVPANLNPRAIYRRAALLEAFAQSSRSSTPDQTNQFHDSGISAGSSSVFQPWLADERGRSSFSRRSASAGNLARSGSRSSNGDSTIPQTSSFQRLNEIRSMSPTGSESHIRMPLRSSRGAQSTGSLNLLLGRSNSPNPNDNSNRGPRALRVGLSRTSSAAVGLSRTSSAAQSAENIRQPSRPTSPLSEGGVGLGLSAHSGVSSRRPMFSLSGRSSRSVLEFADDHEGNTDDESSQNVANGNDSTHWQSATHPDIPRSSTFSGQSLLSLGQSSPQMQPVDHSQRPQSPAQVIHGLTKRLSRPFHNQVHYHTQETPLTTFTTPYLSVKHHLRIQIVCHKPSLIGASQPIFASDFSGESSAATIGTDSVTENDSVDGKDGIAVDGQQVQLVGWSKAASSIGFRHVTTVDIPVVVHQASERDKRFLHSYLYGPNALKGEGEVPGYSENP